MYTALYGLLIVTGSMFRGAMTKVRTTELLGNKDSSPLYFLG